MPDQNGDEAMPGRTITGAWRSLLGDRYVTKWTGRADQFYGQRGDVFPERDSVFGAFAECPLEGLKVVIVGKEPYNGRHATGMAFSVLQGGFVPRSLWIIFSEVLRNGYPGVNHENGDLSRWAEQGVLLINSTLTMGSNERKPQWGSFINTVISRISSEIDRVVFMLWGKEAIEKGDRISNADQHLILRSSHPSPRSAFQSVQGGEPFAGCGHFRRANCFLGRDRAIDWS